MLRRTLVHGAVALAALLLPAAASAAVTATTVTSPSDHSFPFYDGLAQTKGVFAGTAPGASNGDLVDVECVYANTPTASSFKMVLLNLVVTGGVWASAPVSLISIADESCDLRAVPHGVHPALGAAAFPTVRVDVIYDRANILSGHENNYEVASGLDDGYVDLESFAGCGINSMRLYGTSAGVRVTSEYLFNCNDYVSNVRLTPPTEAQRWMMTVDGGRALAPASETPSLPGAQSITHQGSVSAAGVVTVTSSEPMMTCGSLVDPADPLSACATYAPVGVTLDRTITVGAKGRTVRFADTWRSTDGAPHAVDYWTEDDVVDPVAGSNSFQLPGDFAHAIRAVDEVDTVPAGPGTAFIRTKSDVADNSLQFAQGAITWDVAPDKVWFGGSFYAYFHHAVSVPAGGSAATMHRQYAMSDTLAQMADFVAKAPDLFISPTVAITSPTDGAALTGSPVTVSGTATDNVGVASLEVNGVATPVVAGAFSAPLALAAGSNTITVVATDAVGNETAASVMVTYAAPVVVPPVVVPPVVVPPAVVPPVVTPPLQRLFTGTKGTDVLVGNAAANELNGLGGNDRLFCGVGGRDVVDGGPGNDYLDCVEPLAQATGGRDIVNCGAGAKDIALVDPFDTVLGCESVTRVWTGGSAPDTFRGTKANDRFDGRGGNDKVTCGGGIDSALGGPGNDTISCADTGTPAARRKGHDVVNCGAGKHDVAIVDAFDKVSGCETVVLR
ncbi:MAG: hypothetical protein JWM98_814 [Thermoleophilia bacterium]|nr:hypothetical protein [Thermoleophilia bacterium]